MLWINLHLVSLKLPPYTLRRVDNTTFDVLGSVDAMRLVVITATDKYGRRSTLSLYVEVRTAYPPEPVGGWMRRYLSVYRRCPYNAWTSGGSVYNISIPSRAYSMDDYTPCGRYHTCTYDFPRVRLHPGHSVTSSSNVLRFHLGSNLYEMRPNYTYKGREQSGTITIINEIAERATFGVRVNRVYYDDSASGACTSSCFTPDSRILMGDSTELPICEVRVGDYVQTVIGPKRVWRVHTPVLGNRKLVSFNGKCKTGAEHAFWSELEDGTEFWSTRDMDIFHEESLKEEGPNFDDRSPFVYPLEGTLTVATRDGWEDVESKIESSSPDLQLYNLRLEGGGSYFVDGFLVSSRASVDNDVDWNNFKWEGVIQENYPKRDWLYRQDSEGIDTFRHLSKVGKV